MILFQNSMSCQQFSTFAGRQRWAIVADFYAGQPDPADTAPHPVIDPACPYYQYPPPHECDPNGAPEVPEELTCLRHHTHTDAFRATASRVQLALAARRRRGEEIIPKGRNATYARQRHLLLVIMAVTMQLFRRRYRVT